VKHSLPDMSLSAARGLKVRCPEHDMPAQSCTTSHDAVRGDVAKITFDCKCVGVAGIKRVKEVMPDNRQFSANG